MPRPETSAPAAPFGRQIGRKERIGLSLFDLDVLHPVVRKAVLGGKLALSKDQTAMVSSDAVVPFSCGLLEAAVAADLVRDECRKVGDPPVRAYLSQMQAWQRLPADARLTRVIDGRPELSELWFPPRPGEEPFEPPTFDAVV